MFKNYLIISWRNIIREKGYALINISGFAVAMAVAILIGIWVQDEVSYNMSFKHYDRLAQLYHHLTFGEEIMTINDVPAPIGAALKSNYAEFEEVTMTSWPAEHSIAYNEITLFETGLFVEPQFLDMFSVKMLEGTNATLSEVNSVLISKSLARTLFHSDAVGKMIKFDNRDLLLVTGVFDDFKSNTEFADVKMLLPIMYFFSIDETHRQQIDNWEEYSFQCYVRLKEGAALEEVEFKIKNLLFNKASNDGKALNPVALLFPMEKWHLYDTFKDGVNTGGQIKYVWMFGTIGVFVLLLACINFMNLSTARSERRSKEVGVRKVMGSARKQLVFQFLSESFVLVTVGFLLALAIAVISLPWFNDLAGKEMSMPFNNAMFIVTALTFVIITGILAGSYPAWYLSSFSPVKVLKGTFKASRFAAMPRKVMVVFQGITSIVLMTGTFVVFLQINHAKNRPVGFDREGILHVAIRTDALEGTDYNALRHELLSTGIVDNMAISDYPITGTMSANSSLTWEGKDPALKPLVAMNSCSHDFPKTNGFQFVEGRDFSRDFSTDSSAVIVNELAAKLMASGSESIIGKKMSFGYGRQREIIGVIKDQVRWTPFEKQSPHLYYIDYSLNQFITIRLKSMASPHEALPKIEAVIKKMDEGAPFEYKFLDDDYARLFKDEERIGTLAAVFSVLAIFISCIGIFGLAAFTASQRTKEIGIRKVLGASVFTLWKMLSSDFIRLVMVAVILGLPLAYYIAIEWLSQYEYRVELSWMIFIVTGLLALLITLITVSYQAIHAALADPVESLRAE